MDSYDFIFKVVVVGDIGVGKSSLIKHFCARTFDQNLKATIGVDFQVCDVSIGSGYSKKHIRLDLWDTAGEERFRGITSVFYRNAHAVVIVFDLTRKSTFNSLTFWLESVKQYCGEDIHILLVANKCDLESNVSTSDIEEFVYLHSVRCTETSAKNFINIQETFVQLSEDLVLRHDQLLSLSSFDPGPGSIFLEQAPQQVQNYCCGYI